MNFGLRQMRSLGLIEAYGTGIPRIRECYADCPADAKIEVSENAFKVILPNARRAQEASRIGGDLSGNETIALGLFEGKAEVYRRDVEDALGVSTTMANRVLKRLVLQGRIERVGQGRAARYRLKR